MVMAKAPLRPCLLCLQRRPAPATAPRPLRTSPFSSSASVKTDAPTLPPSQGRTVELLRDVRELLRRYPLLEETSWSSRLERALADLQKERRARIAIVGRRGSGASALVTASYDDPLASDGDVSVALASRRLGDAPEAIALTYGETTRVSPHELTLPSSWLQQHQADVVEIVHGDVPPLQSSVDAIYSSDAVVLVFNEQNIPLPSLDQSLLLELAGKPNLVVVVNTSAETSPSFAIRSLELQLETLLPADKRPTIFAVSTIQAMDALVDLLPEDPSQPPSFERFQAGFVRSGVPQLKALLGNAISSIRIPSDTFTPTTSTLQLDTADFLLGRAIDASVSVAARVDDALTASSADIAALVFITKTTEEQVLLDLGVVDGALRVPQVELASAKASLRELLMGRLAWWKLPLRSDDISSEVATVVGNTYLRSFEDKLVFDTGRLLGLSTLMARRTDDLLSTPSFSPSSPPLSSLYSPVLLNHLDQAALESRQISSTDLSSALIHRRNQITTPGGPADILSSRAQTAVASAGALASGSAASAIVMDFFGYAEVATSAGVGLLGTVLAAWLLQKRWNKAVEKFLLDVEGRVTGGLEYDLGATAQRLVDRSLYRTRTAIAGSEQNLARRRSDFDSFASTLSSISHRRSRPA